MKSRIFFLMLVVLVFPNRGFSQSSKPKSGGTLRFGAQRDISSLNPFQDTRAMDTGVRSLVFEPLLMEEDYGVRPHLAESWEISKDGKDYLFRLKKGVKFHNGREMTAQDVHWDFLYTMEPKNRAYSQQVFKAIRSVEAIDAYRVKVTLRQPNAPFLSYLTSIQGLPVVPRESLAQDEKPSRFPPGTGPFVFEDWKPQERIELKRFPEYWQKGIPTVDRLQIRPVPDDEVRLTALRSGEVDLIDRTPMQFIERIKKGELGDLRLTIAPASRILGLHFNLSKPPFDKLESRLAVAYAIDKMEMIRGAHWGLGVAINQKMDPSSPWYFNIPDRKREVTKAKALLEKAGYPKGFRAPALVMAGNESSIQVAQSQVKEIGIDFDLNIAPFATYMRNIQAGNFAIATMGGDAALDPDPNIYEFYRSEEVWTHNYARYKNSRVDQLLDEGRITMDPKKRHRIYREATEILFEEVPTIWTVLAPVFFTYRSYVKGFEVEPQGLFFSGKRGIPMIRLEH